jgi:hypothetical protein
MGRIGDREVVLQAAIALAHPTRHATVRIPPCYRGEETMPAQGQLFTRGNTPTDAPPPPAPAGQQALPDPAPVWLQRASLIVLVIFCFYIGALLAVLPWNSRYWDSNGWLLAHPALEAFLEHGWVRGIVSGLGLLDVWIGVSELLHYRDYRA